MNALALLPAVHPDIPDGYCLEWVAREHAARQARLYRPARPPLPPPVAPKAPKAPKAVLPPHRPRDDFHALRAYLDCDPIDLIIGIASNALDIDPSDICSRNLFPYFVLARWLCIRAAILHTTVSYFHVGRYFGGLSEKSVTAAIVELAERARSDAPFKDMLARFDGAVTARFDELRAASGARG